MTRTEDEHDRRVKRIGLTTAGREITDRLVELRIAGIQEFVDGLDPEQRRKLGAALEGVVDA